MNMKNKGILSILIVSSFASVFAQVAPGWNINDFLIQNVCISATGTVLPYSPTSSMCSSTRDLLPGERLPYHKHDQYGVDANPDAVKGYQRSDSFPSVSLPNTVVQTLDFGVGGRTFGTKDIGDGFNVFETRGSNASIVATDDAIGGIQFFLAPPCNVNASDLSDINDSWIIAPTVFQAGITQSTTTQLMLSHTLNTCPSRYDQSLTFWEIPIAKLGYTSGDLLQTVISYHYSHPTVDGSDHMEKFYFTREFGATRWERWERPNTPYHTDEKTRADTQAAAGTCNGSSVASDHLSDWYRVDCREWTNIITGTSSAPQNWADETLQKLTPQITLSASPLLVAFRKSSTVKWSVTNATDCKFTQGPSVFLTATNVVAGGSKSTGPLYADTDITLRCVGPMGATTRTITVATNSNFLKNLQYVASTALGATPVLAASCTTLDSNLHRGHETLSVSTLQDFLIGKGLLSGKASGFFGDLTVIAVKGYQRSQGLPETGMVYDFTREAIKQETCK
jgi:hypothetical protein